MRLTFYSDYSLRLLMYTALRHGRLLWRRLAGFQRLRHAVGDFLRPRCSGHRQFRLAGLGIRPPSGCESHLLGQRRVALG